jgi:hypothetical protein
VSWPATVLWVLIPAASLSSGPTLLYLLFIAGIFGTLQMIPGDAGGINLLPQSLCAVFFVAKVLLQRGNLAKGLEIAVDLGRLGLFSAFVAYALLTAIVLPSLFAGQIEVTAVSSTQQSLLSPSSGNITQSCYVVLSFGTALCFALIARCEQFLRNFLGSLLAAAIALVASGVVDLTCYHTGLSGLLDPFRTSSYTLLTDNDFEGTKRVVGFTPEASAYGSMCVNLLAALAFLRPLFRTTLRRFVGPALLALITMTALSTSATAYIGLTVFVFVYALELLIRLRSCAPIVHRGVNREIGLLVAVLFALLAIVAVWPHLFDAPFEIVEKVVFQKTYSESYIGRSTWTRVGWRAFFDTGGLGVGLGSLRTSNWFVGILGSTGILGGLLMFGFIIRLFTYRTDGTDLRAAVLARALRFALIPNLVRNGVSGTMPDIGIFTASLFGILAAMPKWSSVKGSVKPRIPRLVGSGSPDALQNQP